MDLFNKSVQNKIVKIQSKYLRIILEPINTSPINAMEVV